MRIADVLGSGIVHHMKHHRNGIHHSFGLWLMCQAVYVLLGVLFNSLYVACYIGVLLHNLVHVLGAAALDACLLSKKGSGTKKRNNGKNKLSVHESVIFDMFLLIDEY